MKARFGLVILVLVVLALPLAPVAAQGDVGDQVTTFFADVEAVMLAIAASAAVIGFIGLAILYLGSAIPIIASWKQENPKAANQVSMGLVILIFVGSGALGGLLTF